MSKFRRTFAAAVLIGLGVTSADAQVLGLGREATAEEIAAWDIDVRPDGAGLPEGRGTAAEGQLLYDERCASCHGVFGEGEGRWPALAGGQGSLTSDRPEKTIGSFWPYPSSIYDYVHRAMPFGDAQSLADDEVYALVAYLLFLNDVVTDENFELSKESFPAIQMENAPNFLDDDRPDTKVLAAGEEPCMENCKPEPAEVTMRAMILDVTPDTDEGDAAAGAGAVD